MIDKSVTILRGFTLEKGRRLPVGTINNYNEIKMPDGTWKYLGKEGKRNPIVEQVQKNNVDSKKLDKLINESKKFAKEEGREDSDIYIEPATSSISLEHLKKLRGDFIYTHLILDRKYEVTSLPQDIKDYIVDERTNSILGRTTTQPIKDQRINIDKIKFTQTFVFEEPLKNKKGDEKVVLYNYKDDYYINDGNHSLIKKVLMGKKYVEADVIEVK